MGAYSRLGAYKILLPLGWALIQDGRSFKVGRSLE